MMKYIFSLVLMGIFYKAQGQNKAPNPSFETLTACPQIMGAPQDPPGPSGTVENLYRAGIGSTDFYNVCSTGPNDVPTNIKGFQQARSGLGYAGFYAIYDQYLASREYLQCELNTPLQPGHHYKVSFWVSLADSNANGLKASDELAVYFSNAFIVVNTPQISNILPQIKQTSGNFISDTANWVEVKDTMLATGGEDHMIIGVFSTFSSQSYLVINGPPAFYQVYYYIDDICIVDLDETTLIDVFDTTICENLASIQLTARSGMESYEWSNGSMMQQTTVFSSGSYWVKSFGSCEMRIDTFNISIFTDSSQIDFGNDTVICFNSNLILNAYDPVYTSYLWNTGATSAQIPVTSSGVYFVSAQSACGTFTDTMQVTVKDEVPSLPSIDTIICATLSRPLTFNLEGTNIRWYDSLSGATYSEQPVIEVDKPGSYEYWVTQTIDGCESRKSRIKVTVLQLPVDPLKDTAVCDQKELWIGSFDGSLKYLWDNGSDSCCIRVTRSGIYYLKMTNFCGDLLDSVRVAILDNCDDCIWVPSAFTPNNDGLNDFFEVKVNCQFKNYHLSIYNRFGQRVFMSTKIDDTWDGTFHNIGCDAGTYYYYIEATPYLGNKSKIAKKGSISLIR